MKLSVPTDASQKFLDVFGFLGCQVWAGSVRNEIQVNKALNLSVKCKSSPVWIFFIQSSQEHARIYYEW